MQQLICAALSVYSFILLIRVIMSWVEVFSRSGLPDAVRPIAKVVYDLTEPVIQFVRRYVGPVGMLDMSVLVIFILIAIARQILCTASF